MNQRTPYKSLNIPDYYPFGLRMSSRSSNSSDYRYGFNGQEKDDEIKGEGNSYDFGARIYDPRIGRWFAEDGIVKPQLSTYQFGNNNPVFYIDKDGNDEYAFNVNTGQMSWVSDMGGKNTQYVSFIQVSDNGSVVKTLANESVNGRNVYITDIGGAEPKFVISNYDLKLAPNYNFYSFKNYEYDGTDLKTRRAIMQGGSVLWTAIKNFEAAGNAQPIDFQNYSSHYGDLAGRLKTFGQFYTMMADLTELGGQLDDAVKMGISSKQVRKIRRQINKTKRGINRAFRDLNSQKINASSKNVSKGKVDGRSNNPWNKWQMKNKGKYKGKNAKKKASKAYKKRKQAYICEKYYYYYS